MKFYSKKFLTNEDFVQENYKFQNQRRNISRRDIRRHGLRADGKFFTLNGIQFRIFSGTMHYFRVPREYWLDRLTKLKASGLNTVETYVAWNLHEQEKGNFDFTGSLDIVRYVTLANTLGLYVIVRPGPYICAEWDWGGLPAWLSEDPNMRVRSLYKGYTEAVEKYFQKLLTLLVPLQYTNGGPIIAVQVENEYGSYGNDKEYLKWCKNLLVQNGITELLFTSDIVKQLDRGSLPDVLSTINFQESADSALNKLASFQPNKPQMVTEFWTGWFDYWGGKRHTLALIDYVQTLEAIVARGASVNLYVFHGGTTFGFTNGASLNRTGDDSFNPHPFYLPLVTSYDYNAPLSESGQITAKYNVLQQVMKKYNPDFHLSPDLENFVQLVNNVAVDYGSLMCHGYIPLTDALNNVFVPMGIITRPTNVENLCQEIPSPCTPPYYGFVAYRVQQQLHNSRLTMKGILRDSMQIIVDGKTVKTIYSARDNVESWIETTESGSDILLLVENMGRVNYDNEHNMLDRQRKGFAGTVTANDRELNRWAVYDLSLKVNAVILLSNSGSWKPFSPNVVVRQPGFYRFLLEIKADFPSDTFINVEGWNKGAIFVNGKNIGRYWKTGPSKTLYLPGPFLRNGVNEIVVFELYSPGSKIVLQRSPDLGIPCFMPCD